MKKFLEYLDFEEELPYICPIKSNVHKNRQMKLSKIAILALRGCGKDFRSQLADKCGVSLRTINRWITNNDDNLTKADALQMIRFETGLQDHEILEEVVETISPQ